MDSELTSRHNTHTSLLQDRQYTYKRSMAAPSRNHLWRGKANNTTNSVCVPVALVIQHAKRMRRIVLISVACLTLPHFSTLSHKRHSFFGGKKYCTLNILNVRKCTI